MVAAACLYGNDFGENLVAGAVGSVLFVFLGLFLSQESERAAQATYDAVEAFAARQYENDRFSEFENCMHSGELGEIIVMRPRSGPDALLFQVQAIRKRGHTQPLMWGSPSRKIFVIRVSAPPLLANREEHREAYELSAVKGGKAYYAQYHDNSGTSPRA